ncbi:MAG: glycine cleavage system protein GcvH [Alphaproteobacteria bacterium]|nr:MAG: glycine cleavage system protein GcvH [Alphaproteobacteria bacterium]
MSIKFTEDHEWVLLEGDIATIGVSDYAQEQLGDVVFVEVPEVGSDVSKGDELSVVESVKAASEVYTPVSGTVIGVNGDLEETPTLVNEEPQGGGWFVKIRIADASELDELMDEAAYKDYVEGLA